MKTKWYYRSLPFWVILIFVIIMIFSIGSIIKLTGAQQDYCFTTGYVDEEHCICSYSGGHYDEEGNVITFCVIYNPRHPFWIPPNEEDEK